MKKVIMGGFLTLSGVVGIVSSYLAASFDLVSAWNSFPGRAISTMLTNGMMVPFLLGIALFAWGLYLMIIGCGEKE